jgi:uncharacterized protein YbjT (DUF2867 family)
MQNFVNFFGQTIRTQSAFYIPAGDGKVSFVDARDIAAVATQILWLKLMEPKSTIITRTRNMALLVTRLYHIVKWQKFFLMLLVGE